MIPLPENMSTVVVTLKDDKTVWGQVVRTQTGMKYEGKGAERKKVPERLVSVRDTEGAEHTFNLDTEVALLKVTEERKAALARIDAESKDPAAPDDATPEGEAV